MNKDFQILVLAFLLGGITALLLFYPDVEKCVDNGRNVDKYNVIDTTLVYYDTIPYYDTVKIKRFINVGVPAAEDVTTPEIGRLKKYSGTSLINGYTLSYNITTKGELFSHEYHVGGPVIRQVKLINHTNVVKLPPNPWLFMAGTGIQLKSGGLENILAGVDVGYKRHSVSYNVGFSPSEVGFSHQVMYKRRFGW